MTEEADLPSVNWFLCQANVSAPKMNEVIDKRKNTSQLHLRIDFKANPLKPPYSYSQLIIMAFKQNVGKKLTLNEIFKYISEEFAYYKNDDQKWKNSVRHLLSLDKRFIKVPREKSEKGKGAFWVLDPQVARRRSPIAPRTRSPKASEDKNVKPHLNPAVIKLLHVLNERKTKEKIITPINRPDYIPNFSSLDHSYTDKDLWVEQNVPYLNHSDHSYSSSQNSSPSTQEWLIEDLSEACPMGRSADEFFDNFYKNEEKEHLHSYSNCTPNFSHVSHPWQEGPSMTNYNNSHNNYDFNNNVSSDFDFYDELLC